MATVETHVSARPSPGAGASGQPAISPYFICRASGVPVSTLDTLIWDQSSVWLNRLRQREGTILERRDVLIGRLYQLVGTASDKVRRHQLLELKRAVYRLDILPDSDDTALSGMLDARDLGELDGLRAAIGALNVDRECFSEAYQSARNRLRGEIKALYRDPNFRKGLLASSRTLFERWRNVGVAHRAEHSRTAKMERGLLRYYTRMAAKATPFGTFCSIVAGSFENQTSESALTFRGDARPSRSRVRLNKKLFTPLFAHLKRRPESRRGLSIDVNPTLSVRGKDFYFLAGMGHHEILQRLERNSVLQALVTHLTRSTSRSFAELVDLILSDGRFDTSTAEVEAYLVRLLEIGLLRFRSGIREQDTNWDRRLEALCRKQGDEHAIRIAHLLASLRRSRRAFVEADADRRFTILDDAHAQVDRTFQELGIPPVRRFLAFYEDTTADAALVLQKRRTDAPFTDLVDFMNLALRIAWPRTEQATMRHFFDQHYDRRVSVPLLEFYEDYFREHFKEHLQREAEARRGRVKENYDLGNPMGLEFIGALRTAERRIAREIRKSWAVDPDAEEIVLRREAMEEALREVPSPPNAGCSLNVFVQAIPPTDGGCRFSLLLPAGAFLAGYGKYFSRFLYLLPRRMRRGVRRRNRSLSDARLAEISADGDFNANLHPPLLDDEIAYPTSEGGVAETQLAATDLRVERDPSDPHALTLVHGPTSERVVPVDLGFLNPRMRPPLYQLLSRLGPPLRFSLTLPTALPMGVDEGHGADGSQPQAERPKVTYRPRIVFGEGLILSRRTWFVPAVAYPSRFFNEDDASYFLRVNRWRSQHDIPEQVYIHISHRFAQVTKNTTVSQRLADEHGADASTDRERTRRRTQSGSPGAYQRRRPTVSGDLRKPQFIDFRSPHLIDVFERFPKPLEDFVALIEERLPARSGLPEATEGPHTTELIMQVDFPEAHGRRRNS